MRIQKRVGGFAAIIVSASLLIAPLAGAQSLTQQSAQRQKQKNTWRNLAYGAGAVALYGLLKKDNTITFAGAAGALYSLHRYEQDRKSQSKIDRARAAAFGRRSFTRNGVRYVRRTVRKNGKTYYQFVRA